MYGVLPLNILINRNIIKDLTKRLSFQYQYLVLILK